ncbi:MAG: carbamoyltransferase HypF, partial [Planctomycetes bacterium]|nr:carbamoyltransferase HypF [Planctomycetota bacterium]
RRFHAQPNACPACGPRLRLTYPDRTAVAGDALAQTVRLLRAGKIVAVKGIGGYHLACRADLEDPVARLRTRKLRDGKPLALMVANVAAARRLCRLSDADVETLSSVVAPIVLAPKRAGHRIAASVAPGCRDFGLMLPYAPLHHLLFAEGLEPLVMTSANLAGQPLTYDDDDAYAVLGDVADAFLTHDRRIFRPIDDSVVFTFRSHAVPLRRARGYAPRPLRLELRVSESAPRSRRILALGGELKSTVCLVRENEATLSEHLGDLTRPDTYRHFVRAIARLRELFDFEPEVVAHDLHPRYLATKYAQELALPVLPVQHHHAHVASVMAEWGEAGPLIGLACDGTGYGTDGAVWGCEVLLCARGRFERVGHLEYFPLVGADRAALETWRPAGALLHAALGDQWRTLLGKLAEQSHLPEALSAGQLDVFAQQLASGLNAPPTSSLGRVFDAVGFLLGLCVLNRHEAEAAMALEGAAGRERGEAFRYEVRQAGSEMHLSVVPTIADIVDAVRSGDRRELIAARFHETIARMLLEAAVRGCELHGVCTVGLSGGCFANRRLLSRVTELLEQRRVRVLYHRQVPCGDGGVALGQAVVAAWQAVESAASPSVMEITP